MQAMAPLLCKVTALQGAELVRLAGSESTARAFTAALLDHTQEITRTVKFVFELPDNHGKTMYATSPSCNPYYDTGNMQIHVHVVTHLRDMAFACNITASLQAPCVCVCARVCAPCSDGVGGGVRSPGRCGCDGRYAHGGGVSTHPSCWPHPLLCSHAG